MIYGYRHKCKAGHVFTQLVLFGPKPECAQCKLDAKFAAIEREMVERRNRDRLRPSYIVNRPQSPRPRSHVREPASTVRRDDTTITHDYPLPYYMSRSEDRSYEERKQIFSSGGGGDFGGGGATSSWAPVEDHCSRSEPTSGYSSSSSDSYSSSDSSSSSSSPSSD